jgi:host cell surface-exposed lipoprotein/uncharacterized protein DUF2510
MSTPAGWYPDPQAEGQQRYWDGNDWTEHQAPVAQPQQPTPPAWTAPQQSAPYAGAAPVAAKQKKPFWRRTWVLVTAGVIVVFIGIGAASGSSDPKDTAAKDNHAKVKQDKTSDPANEAPSTPDVTRAADDPSPSPSKTPKPKPTKTAPSYTVSQEQAIGSAKNYLSISGFSRSGLIQQLSSSYGDGFSKADATFAVNHIKVDWNEQAVRSAKNYLSISHFSRAGLIQQLSSSYGDGYTVAQATYAVNHVGL